MTTPVSELLDFDTARDAVARIARVTPLLEVPVLAERVGAPVHLKLECLQVTGSFKVRGAAARLTALDEEERSRGVVACSSGNHGKAVAHVAARFGIPATVYVPAWVDPVKLEGIRGAGAEAILAGDTFDEAEARALAHAGETGRAYVSAYDDPWIAAGQGTIALEIVEQLGTAPGAVLTPLSGGGLMGGIAAAMRRRLGDGTPRTVAVSAKAARVMQASLEAGRPVELPEEETLATALSGGIGLDNRYTFPLIRELVDEHATVTEKEIEEAMAFAVNHVHVVAEGGGAAALAALLAEAWRPPSGLRGPVVAVVSGGNVAPETLADVLAR